MMRGKITISFDRVTVVQDVWCEPKTFKDILEPCILDLVTLEQFGVTIDTCSRRLFVSVSYLSVSRELAVSLPEC